MSYQSLTIVGNLGKDPEMRYTPSGTPVTGFSVATNRKYTGKDGQVIKEVTWFRVSVFGKMAEACAEYLKKGSAVLVEGHLTPDKETGGPRTYERKDGGAGATYEVFANTVRFLGGKDHEANAGKGQDEDEQPIPGAETDEIPF
jgi:single-strand DNA-binding protein